MYDLYWREIEKSSQEDGSAELVSRCRIEAVYEVKWQDVSQQRAK